LSFINVVTGTGERRQPAVDMTTGGCHDGDMSKHIESPEHVALLDKLKETRAAALEHTRIAREFARERRRVIDALLAEGFSQSDLARELGVTRQAIQKMVAVGAEK
jgi:DNA-binding NarL/FixJ family response regulator